MRKGWEPKAAKHPTVVILSEVESSFSPAHDVNREDPALMPRQQIIDKTSDDGIRFVTGLGHDPANESSARSMPLEINCAMSFLAVNFSPPVGAARSLMLRRNQAETLETRVGHDFLAQRAAPSGDDLDNGLHRWLLGSALKTVLQRLLINRRT